MHEHHHQRQASVRELPKPRQARRCQMHDHQDLHDRLQGLPQLPRHFPRSSKIDLSVRYRDHHQTSHWLLHNAAAEPRWHANSEQSQSQKVWREWLCPARCLGVYYWSRVLSHHQQRSSLFPEAASSLESSFCLSVCSM